MNRTIPISTDVFAAIWAQRKDGEETEDAILRRLLGCPDGTADLVGDAPAEVGAGFVDTRNGVEFPRGFTIFRTYKRKEYAAVAEDGHWRRTDNGATYASLNQLNASITAGNENVWNGNWKYRRADGALKSIAELRT